FSLLTLTGTDRSHASTDFAFFCRRVEQLQEPDRHFSLSADEIRLMNPNTGTCPIFRSQRDAEINKVIYRRVPVLIREGTPEENPWGIGFLRMLDMANDSGLFRTREQLEADGWSLDGNRFRQGDRTYLPLYEAKMVHHFDHRFGTYEGQTDSQANQSKLPELEEAQHADPRRVCLPRYWVPAEKVEERIQGRSEREWLLGWRDVCRNTDTRTLIASFIPRAGVGDKFLLMFPTAAEHRHATCLLANLNSHVLDYCARQKIGGTALKYFIMRQLPYSLLRPTTKNRLGAKLN
ncbi:MAG: restriction endonuclease, partial [Fimbriimonadales bacterium]